MGRVSWLGLCVTAALAALSAPAAWAQAPEFGRCVKQAHGKFKDIGCSVAAAPGMGKLEWLPGVVKNKFTTLSKKKTVIDIETVAGNKLRCTGEHGGGEYTGPKTLAHIVLTFTGCESGSIRCSSAGAAAGEVATSALEGEVGVIKKGAMPTSTEVGVRVSAPNLFAAAACGPIAIDIRGSAIAPLLSNSMKRIYAVEFAESKGKQQPERFEGGPPTVLEWEGAGKEQAALTLAMLLANEDKVELSTVN